LETAPLRGMTAGFKLEPISFGNIEGWTENDFADAFPAFLRSCRETLETGGSFRRPPAVAGDRADWLSLCRHAAALGEKVPSAGARQFFERSFTPFLVRDLSRPQGLFTGYFEPEAMGDLHRHGDYAVPLYGKPPDLVAFDSEIEKRVKLRYGRMVEGDPRPYFTRRQIEEGALAGKGLEIAWLKSWADAFFIHVQGSGRVRLPDGRVMRLAYAAKSGLPYTSIGGLLVERKEIDRSEMSMQAIRRWMDRNPKQARALMWENRSFVFFRKLAVDDPTLGPPGAQHVQLTPLRSVAVDREIWPFGLPLWIETELPFPSTGGTREFRRLMIAQDTGSAIKGAVRVDVFFGSGDEAALMAGHMKSAGRMIVLLPRKIAERMNAAGEP
ncbi:MAG TPA: MltA domain-containing protein, partial [Aestuariivirgaceae bacterium]